MPTNTPEYAKAYRKAHKAERRALDALRRAEHLASRRQWKAKHRKELAAAARAWRAANLEESRAREAAYRAAHRKERAAAAQAYTAEHREERRAYVREWIRRRREVPFTWSRVEPWPTDCMICGLPFEGSWPEPRSQTIGHEPPVAWMLRHPEYDGPLILRPEHWGCNARKGSRPDWDAKEGT